MIASSAWDLDLPSVLAFALPGVVVPFVCLVLAFRRPTATQLDRWASLCGISLDPSGAQFARRHLGRVRRFRSIAAFPFWWLVSIRIIRSDFPPWIATPVPAIAAYLLGSLIASVTASAPRASGPHRQTVVVRRSVADYAPRWIRDLPWILISSSTLVVVMLRVTRPSLDLGATAATIAGTALFAGLCRLTVRAIARRPQPGVDQRQLAVDDALRATDAANATAAATLAGLLAAVAAGSAIHDAGSSWSTGPVALFITFTAQAFAFGLLVLVVRQEIWGYRRRHRPAARSLETT